MTKFIFVDGDGNIDIEVSAIAQTEREARKIAWAQLTEDQKDACGFLDCVDEVHECTHHRTIDLHGIELDVEFWPSEPGDDGIEITAVRAPGGKRNLSDLFTDEAFQEIADIIIKER